MQELYDGAPLSQDQLHAFAAVAREGSFTGAASALHLSQPALSRRIAGLEGILLGVELGLGRAVKPRHTVPNRAAVRVDPSFVPIGKPVFLHYRRQRYYGRLAEQREIEQAFAAAGLVDVEFVPDALVRGLWLGTRPGD